MQPHCLVFMLLIGIYLLLVALVSSKHEQKNLFSNKFSGCHAMDHACKYDVQGRI